MRSFLTRAAAFGTPVFLLAAGAHAEVPAEVTEAITSLKADGIVVATAFLVAALAIAAIKFLRSAK